MNEKLSDRVRAEPVAPKERIGALDALRGLALFGVLAINLETEFRVSIFQQFLSHASERGLDRLIDAGLGIFVDMKAFAVFSLLFGIGLAIQYERTGVGPRRVVLLTRRMLALLAFGLVHLFLIWNGDILTEYALAGLLVLPFLFAPNWLVILAAATSLLLYLVIPYLPPLIAFPEPGWLQEHVRSANQVYATGSFGQVLTFRIEEIRALLPLHADIFPRTVGLFLIGVFAWRAGLVRNAKDWVSWLWAAAALGIVVGLILTLATSGREYTGWPPLGQIAVFAAPIGTILLAVGYAAAVLAIGTLNGFRQLLAWVEPLGRMAFTNYIVQSLIVGWIFYGYGLGLFGRIGSAVGFGLVLAIYAGQATFSRWWLGRFRYGPLEWLWRAIMYGSLPPFRMRPPLRAVGAADPRAVD